MKKFISLALTAVLAFGMSTTAFASDIKVSADGKPVVWTDAKPFVNKDGRTMVPLRPIANALGVTVRWDAESQAAHFTKGEYMEQGVSFFMGETRCIYFIDGEGIHLEMDTVPSVINGRTYAPAKYLAEAFDYAVGWNQATKSVTLTKEVPVKLDLSTAPATAAEAKTPKEAMALALTKLENNVFIRFGDSASSIGEGIHKVTDPLFAGTPYKLTADLCTYTFDTGERAGECRMTVVNTETKESFRMIHVFIPLNYYPEGE